MKTTFTIDVFVLSYLGFGWRLGFLGLLHMEVFSQRLEDEYDAEVIITTPSVPFKVKISFK
jgi:translation elongation factor EF-4